MAATVTQMASIQLVQRNNNSNTNNNSATSSSNSNSTSNTYSANRHPMSVGSTNTGGASLATSAANVSHMPYGLGLLTTVASLPPKYRSRYLNIKTKSEIPLDLSVKPISPQIANDVPVAVSFTEVYTEPPATAASEAFLPAANVKAESAAAIEDFIAEELVGGEAAAIRGAVETVETSRTIVTLVNFNNASSINNNNNNNSHTSNSNSNASSTELTKPIITPPPTPTKRKFSEHSSSDINDTDALVERIIAETYGNPVKMSKTSEHPTTKRDSTPAKPIRTSDSAPRTIKAQPAASRPSKNKATRKLKFDEETSSPVSGTIIRPLEDITDGLIQYSNGDIDPKYNIVEITEETKAELAAIKNVIGDYICKLCRLKFDDAFGLAQHRCACIVLLEYRCPECGKQFNCPANLASHRRWHKPKKENQASATSGGSNRTSNNNNTNKNSNSNSNSIAKKENRNTTNFGGVAAAAKQQLPGKSKAGGLLATISASTTSTALDRSSPVGKKSEDMSYACLECGKKFKRQAYLRKHQLSHGSSADTSTASARQTAAKSKATTTSGDAAIAATSKTKAPTKVLATKVQTIIATTAKYQHHSDSDSSVVSSLLSLNSLRGTLGDGSHSAIDAEPEDSGFDAAMYSRSQHAGPSSREFAGEQQHAYSAAGFDNVGAHYIRGNDNFAMTHRNDEEHNDSDDDSMSDYSTSSAGYGRLQIVETGLTEEENIAAAALTNLRNCASVIQHTTLAH